MDVTCSPVTNRLILKSRDQVPQLRSRATSVQMYSRLLKRLFHFDFDAFFDTLRFTFDTTPFDFDTSPFDFDAFNFKAF